MSPSPRSISAFSTSPISRCPIPTAGIIGQRQLGVEFRDLYGQLIDPTQGILAPCARAATRRRSRLGTPPPTSVLVALHSGVVEVGADGTASVSFDMPDFSGTVRVMAMAWTATAVGHGSADVIVRDPVVTTLSPPRFLHLGDTSRLLVEINNVSGPAGTYKVDLIAGDGLIDRRRRRRASISPPGREPRSTLALTGTAIGDQHIKLTDHAARRHRAGQGTRPRRPRRRARRRPRAS